MYLFRFGSPQLVEGTYPGSPGAADRLPRGFNALARGFKAPAAPSILPINRRRSSWQPKIDCPGDLKPLAVDLRHLLFLNRDDF